MRLFHGLITTLTLIAAGSPVAGQSFAIEGARIVTMAGPVIERGTVVVEDGKITAVGTDVSVPGRTRKIDGEGLTVYPGLFDSSTRLGLTEIGAVDVTNDYVEIGEFNPHLLAFSAFHVESEHIPVARTNGITHAVSMPASGRISGQAAIMHLDGWSPEEMEIRRHGALVLDFPSQLSAGGSGFFFGRQVRRPYSEIKKEYEQNIRELKELFARARHYGKARQADAADFDRRLEALVPYVNGELPVMIDAQSHVDIKNAVAFAEEENLNYVVTGAIDAWRVADFLKEHNVRVILGPRQNLPTREDDPIDILYRTPAILHEKGVEFAIATGNAAAVRNLPYEAGNAVAYGLPWEAGIRAITLAPAEFLGVADRVGSVEPGKVANLVVVGGDILEYQSPIRYLFINGQPVSLESKHTELYEKYINRP